MTVTPEPRTLRLRFQNARRTAADGAAGLRRHWETLSWSWSAFYGWFAATLCALLACALLWLYFLDWNTMRGPVARYASLRLGREVRIDGDLAVRLFSLTPHVDVSGLKVVNPGWVGQPLAADTAHVSFSFRLIPLLFGHLILPSVEMDRPQIQIVRNAGGRTNWDFGKSGDGWHIPVINHFVIQNGRLTIDDRVRKMVFVGTVSSHENAGNGNNAFELAGQGTLNGNKFVAEIRGGALLHVDEAKPYIFTADIHSGATHIEAQGDIPNPFYLGRFRAATTFSGTNLSDLYYLTGLAFPGTPPYRLSGTLTREGPIFYLSELTGIIGETDLHGAMTVDTKRSPPFVRGTLRSHKLIFADLGPLFGAPLHGHPVHRLSNAQRISTAVAQPGGLLPDVSLHIERFRQMNANVQYDADTIVSHDLPLRDLHVHVGLDGGVMMLDPIAFDFTRGRLAGSVRIDGRKAIAATDIDVRLTNIRLEKFVSSNPPAIEGLLEARAKLHGVGNSVHKAASNANGAMTFVVPSGKVRKSFAELTGIDVLNGLGLVLTNDKSDMGLRCAVARFDARNGVLRAQKITVDTDEIAIAGEGSVDLGNETLNMSISGKPKEFRIGRIRAPLLVTGSLSHPDVHVKASAALLQGGIAVLLGFIAPPAALLAFVDPGLEKDANCVALTQQASRGTAPVKKLPAGAVTQSRSRN
jgi:AsmA family protein